MISLLTKISIIVIIFIIVSCAAIASIWQVGPSRQYKFCSEVAPIVKDGDTVLIDSAEYVNDDQVSWTRNNLVIKGINGKPHIDAGDKIANDNINGKGIFVIMGNNTLIENIKFSNAKVPDHNGAGIRQHGVSMTVRHCVFTKNEMGILQGGTRGTDIIEHCIFDNGGSSSNPGYQHNIYINHLDTLIFRFNYTHDAIAEGHEFKSRANNTYILYNRISNYNSADSRNIDLPNGGTAVIMGNIIEQGANSANSNFVGYGLEGLTNPGPHNLWVVNNTIINRKSKGSFFNLGALDTLFIANNFFLGAKTGGFMTGSAKFLDSAANIINDNLDFPGFRDLQNYDYHLTQNSQAISGGISPNYFPGGMLLIPEFEYKDSADFSPRRADAIIDIGAYEYGQETGAEEIAPVEELIVYPNPAANQLHIALQEGSSLEGIEIYNLFGEKLMVCQELLLDISNLPAGGYYIRCKTNKALIIKRFIVVK